MQLFFHLNIEAIVKLLIGLISGLLCVGNKDVWGEGEKQGNSWSAEQLEHTLLLINSLSYVTAFQGPLPRKILTVTSKITDHRITITTV